MVGTASGTGRPRSYLPPGLPNDIRHHLDEHRVVIRRLGPDDGEADLPRDLHCLVIEVVQDLDVIADEADRAEHCRLEPVPARVAQVVADIRFQPGVFRPSASALIHERPVGTTEAIGHQPGGRHQLLAIRVRVGHRLRDAVRRKDDPRALAQRFGQRVERSLDVSRPDTDEVGMLVPVSDVRHWNVGASALAHGFARGTDVLAILQAARITSMRRHHETYGVAPAGARHL